MPQRRLRYIGLGFIAPSLLGLLVFYIIPFFGSLYYTFTAGVAVKGFVGLQNFADLIGNPTFELAAKNTAIFMGVGVPLLLGLALLLSLLMLESKFVFERWALLTPLIVPIASVVAGWQMIAGQGGLLNRILEFLGRQGVDVFGGEWAMGVAIAVYIWKNLGYLVIILTSAMVAIPREYNEVFRLESRSRVQQTFKVTLPLITPMLFFSVIIAVMNSFKTFREIYIFFGQNPPQTVYMLQHFMNNNFFKLNYQRLSTAAFLLTGVLFILIWVFLRWQNKFSKDL